MNGELIGKSRYELTIEAQHGRKAIERMSDEACPHGAHWMQTILERRHDAEVSAASSQRPEQIRMLRLACRDDARVVKDDPSGQEIIDGISASAHQPAQPA